MTAVQKKATRASFGEALVQLGADYPQVVVLDADLSKSTKSEGFSKKYPNRFFQMGIQEANMIGVAAGMSFSGKVPFLCSFGAFLSGRFDTIRVTVGYAQANVRLIGTHAGVGIGEDGCSQMALEDLACMRVLPGMLVLQPADDIETHAMMEYLCRHQGPAYVRLSRQDLPRVHSENYRFEPGKAHTIKEGSDTVVFATGALVGSALEASKELSTKGLNVGVVNVSSIKPIDRASIEKYASQFKTIFTAEDHSVIGGLGAAVSEVTSGLGLACKVVRIGVNDVYGESGTPEDLYRFHKLDGVGVAHTIQSYF
ncbi:MAG: transketolase [Bdellovibrionales bacterium CG10_big_fil_rev_8_21_14_0_10_45_34]|nr:MAG: transketolase [Bdellovibrionales bacterium CG10_big_fil_rev_8_21_14_0_10_45_34]